MDILIIEDLPLQQKLLRQLVRTNQKKESVVGSLRKAISVISKSRKAHGWILDGYFPCVDGGSPIYDPKEVRQWIQENLPNVYKKGAEGDNETAMGSTLIRILLSLGYILPDTIMLFSGEALANLDMQMTLQENGYTGKIVISNKPDTDQIQAALKEIQAS